jgi:hypothetical protein
MSSAPNWAEQLTGIGTALGALGLLGAILAAIYAGRQVREARISREAQTAVEFFRRWNDDALVEARRLLATFQTPEELKTALRATSPRTPPRRTCSIASSTTSSSSRRSRSAALSISS